MPVRSSAVGEPRLNSDFWKFWIGQAISTLGSSFTSFALPLLIFKLTGSSLNLALAVVATVLPFLKRKKSLKSAIMPDGTNISDEREG